MLIVSSLMILLKKKFIIPRPREACVRLVAVAVAAVAVEAVAVAAVAFASGLIGGSGCCTAYFGTNRKHLQRVYYCL